MKRFYCVYCKKVRRVRVLPRLVPLARITVAENWLDDETGEVTHKVGEVVMNPSIIQREGLCRRHGV